MSDLVCVAYKERDTADQVLNELRQLQVEHLIDLEDACVAVRDDNGKVHLKQAVNLVAASAAGGSLWGGMLGLLVGIVFMSSFTARLARRRRDRRGLGRALRQKPPTTASTTSSSNRSARPSSRARPPCSSWCARRPLEQGPAAGREVRRHDPQDLAQPRAGRADSQGPGGRDLSSRRTPRRIEIPRATRRAKTDGRHFPGLVGQSDGRRPWMKAFSKRRGCSPSQRSVRWRRMASGRGCNGSGTGSRMR